MDDQPAWRTLEARAAGEIVAEFGDHARTVPLLAEILRAAGFVGDARTARLLADLEATPPASGSVARVLHRVHGTDKATAEQWIREFASEHVDLPYDEFVLAATSWVRERDTLELSSGQEEYYVAPEKWEELWAHYEVVTGEHPDDYPHRNDAYAPPTQHSFFLYPDPDPYSCSC